MSPKIEILQGQAFSDALHSLAQLRIKVFRDWPYLYDGDVEYEAQYLERFRNAKNAFLAVVLDGDELVGATTAAPLSGEVDEFKAPFEKVGIDVADVFYFAESLLLTEFRGLGLGHRFFDLREAHAARLGDFKHAAFCSVVRPSDHPRKPHDYRALDDFWRKRGYQPIEDLTTEFSWKDVGESHESDKLMQFWMKDL